MVYFLPAFPVSLVPDHGKHTLLINILTAVLGAMFFVAAIIVVMIFKKLKREKIKKQLAIETARAVIVTHWTKKVVVEKQGLNGTPTTTGDGLVSFKTIAIVYIIANYVGWPNGRPIPAGGKVRL